MCCYKCQRYGHGKDRCKKPAAVCVRGGKGGRVERDCSADPFCVNCRGDHAASSKTCPKFLEEQAILHFKAENGGTFQQTRKAVVVEIHKTISMRTFASAVKSQLRTKPAALPKDSGRSAPSAPPKGKKAQKDSPAPSPQGAAEAEVPAKRRAEKSKRHEAPRETVNRFAPLAMDAEDTITSIWGDSSTPSSPRASASPMECSPSPSKPQSPSKSRPPSSAVKPQGPPPSPSPPYPFTPKVQVTEGVKATKKIKGLAGQPKVSKLFLAELFEQLPKPFLVLGDFNVHSPAWGDSRRWRMLEEFIAENDFIILNSGEQTFVHSAYHSTSAIDFAVASPSIAAKCSWTAHSDLCGSDHFPIFLTLSSNFSSNFLRHLPESCPHTLLKLFNNIWTTGDIPPSWREASVVPIPKPWKDPSDPSNYRPIALTSCLCKTLEQMVNDRLVHVLESRNLLSNVQCGFRKDHSTLDHLVRLETFIKKAFARKKQVLAVFFDLEKAYDTTWRYGILKDLFDLDFRGRLPIFISNFLKDRHFKVKAENTFSSSYHQENGVPQGSVLSPMLFNLKINNIINSVSKHVNSSLFVDDFAIYAEGKHLQHLECTIQLCINNIQKWVSENGFRFSVSKTTCVHFHRQRIYTEPALHLDCQQIPVKGEAKFLGVFFDSKLNFSSHVKYLEKKGLKALNLLRVVGHTDWGADRATLLRLYHTLVRSKLDYGSVIYGSANKHVLRALDPIHHQGLRIALGAFRTTPIKSLYAKAWEPSLEHRCMKLAFNYVLKLKSLPRNPCHEVVFEALLS
ncbi:Pol-like protein [Plakobranchus ocellatus]|uniref:Pol-like protein n=1 Tax=Plakobranchus ocellatus TaxID=259542 RepID=A0AAV4BDU5_9GAST|nr:Pol-like protein [Plakobranchus ocellatus]